MNIYTTVPSGEQVVVAFITAQTQAQNLGQRDLNLVNNLEIPAN